MNDLGGKTHELNSKMTDEEKTWSLIAHLSALISGILGPLIIFFVFSEKKIVKANALQALVFNGIVFVASILVGVISVITCGFGAILFPVLIIFAVIYIVIAAMRVNEQKFYEYPLCGMIIGQPDLSSENTMTATPAQEIPAAPETPEAPADEQNESDSNDDDAESVDEGEEK